MPERFATLTDGVAMLVTDLHGDRDAFDRYVTRFRTLYDRRKVQRLVLLGDLIHGYGPPDKDGSLSMIMDVMALRDEFGPDTVRLLLGNHEMPHIYGVSLSKGGMEFTPRFEHALGAHREAVIAFLESLPFYIRTAAGVMLSHAGPALNVIGRVDSLREFDHRALLDEADTTLAQSDDLSDLYRQYQTLYGAPYDELARRYLAVSGPDDPRYPHLLRALIISHQSPPFATLWDALFTQNEAGIAPAAYANGCQQFLDAFSVGAPCPQRVMVSGHIVTPGGGYTVVNEHHLRIASATHARPREAGYYLILDCAQPVESAKELVKNLHSVWQ